MRAPGTDTSLTFSSLVRASFSPPNHLSPSSLPSTLLLTSFSVGHFPLALTLSFLVVSACETPPRLYSRSLNGRQTWEACAAADGQYNSSRVSLTMDAQHNAGCMRMSVLVIRRLFGGTTHSPPSPRLPFACDEHDGKSGSRLAFCVPALGAAQITASTNAVLTDCAIISLDKTANTVAVAEPPSPCFGAGDTIYAFNLRIGRVLVSSASFRRHPERCGRGSAAPFSLPSDIVLILRGGRGGCFPTSVPSCLPFYLRNGTSGFLPCLTLPSFLTTLPASAIPRWPCSHGLLAQ
ncbi:hypothetical protein B0H19DRAFT_1268901 [Mycena capillaripes]|nr:hypothetical protein B0H19DRAFT_1268901 [Mycena capillaripes]